MPDLSSTQRTIDGSTSSRWLDTLMLRMLGDNITLARHQWKELAESIRPDSELYQRIVAMLARES